LLAAQRLGDGAVVVVHLQGAEVLGAKIECLPTIRLAAQPTFQAAHQLAHGWSLRLWMQCYPRIAIRGLGVLVLGGGSHPESGRGATKTPLPDRREEEA